MFLVTEVTEKTSKNTHNFICEKCDFKCSKKGDYNANIVYLRNFLLSCRHVCWLKLSV